MAVSTGAAWGADDPAAARERLDDVRGALQRDQSKQAELADAAARQAAELDRLRTQLSAAAAAAQAHEAAISALETDLQGLAAEKALKIKDLNKRKGQMSDTLAALQRMALRPTAALIVSPGDPNDVVRSGLLLRTAVPAIEVQTRALKRQLAEIADLGAEIEGKREQLQTASLALSREQERLGELTAAKNRNLRQTESERKATQQSIAALTKEAKSLEELLARLNRATTALPRPKPEIGAPQSRSDDNLIATPKLPPITAAQGRLTPPAQGVVVKNFGALTDSGGKTRGVTWRTRAAAVIVAPWEGQVVFAGEFRSFGRILIIDHGEGYHSLIAGLGRLDAQIDQWVLAGEPVGVAGGESSDNSLDKGGSGRRGASRRIDPGYRGSNLVRRAAARRTTD